MRRHDSPKHPGINMAHIPVGNWIGLVITVGVMFMFLTALPQIRWFFLLTLPAGVLVGAILTFLHRR